MAQMGGHLPAHLHQLGYSAAIPIFLRVELASERGDRSRRGPAKMVIPPFEGWR